MSIDYTGTNTEKTDKVIASVIDLTATLRVLRAIVAVCFPMLVGLNVFFTARLFEASYKIDRTDDRAARIEKSVEAIDPRLNRVQADVQQLKTDVQQLKTDVQQLKIDVQRVEKKLDMLIDKLVTPPKPP